MEKVNYKQFYQKLTKGLSQKTKDIFERRFGMKTGTPETLEAIGKTFSITRERVRQIEEVGFNYVRKQNKELLDEVYADFARYFESKGGFKKEEIALEELGGKAQKPYVLFLLTLGDQFSRICEKKDFYYFWSTMPEAKSKVKENLGVLVADMQKIGEPISKEEFYAKIASQKGISQDASFSYLEISKRIQENKEGKLGLTDWPEIKPRGVRDKAFLVFKKHAKPLHFTDVAKLIDELEYSASDKKTYPQTVHNELIKDARFVLVGRGTYALAEWGYVPGTIKDIITNILSQKTDPIHRDEIVKEVLTQRLVAKNTVLMNLNNKKYFEKGEGDRYTIKTI
ncbi:MAG: HTH domain-containing protein [Clostridia bacterium]